MRRFVLWLVVLVALGVGAGEARRCPEAGAESESEEPAGKPELLGELTREEVEVALPDWVAAEVAAQPDPEAASALAQVPVGAKVTVYLGTWCSDSKRELARFWRALDEVGGMVPFTLRYIGVDEDKKEPAELVEGLDLQYVPTFIVRRGDQEVGRIVEEAPNGIERDLLDLLTGAKQGLVTAKEELLTGGEPGE